MKLFVDDERSVPVEYGEGWTVVKTYQDAIEWLSVNQPTHISLDNDLGPASQGSGYQILDWLEEQNVVSGRPWPEFFAIHTANPEARRRMKLALKRGFRYRASGEVRNKQLYSEIFQWKQRE